VAVSNEGLAVPAAGVFILAYSLELALSPSKLGFTLRK